MATDQRRSLISQLETELGARLLVLVTGDRQQMETRIAPDLLPLVSEHLTDIGDTERLALFLYTPGGDTIAAWGLINLLRQYCSELLVMVPARAMSAGTLLALGADRILMGRHGFLGPIDPSVASPFNPQIQAPGAPGQMALVPVSVEDMAGFFSLARDEAKLTSEPSMVEVLKILAQHVHPLALGAVHRAREQSGELARRMLRQHMDDKNLEDRIVSRLSQELPTHGYLIGRKEATEDIGIPLADVAPVVEAAMWGLHQEYSDWLQLNVAVSSESDLGSQPSANVRYERAVIESLVGGSLRRHVYVTEKTLSRVSIPAPGLGIPIEQVLERTLFQGWQRQADQVDQEESHDP